MADPTNINTMQLLSAQNQPNSDSEDASAAGTYGVRPEFQQIQATLRGVSLDDGWETINGLLNVAWTGGLAPTYISSTSFSYQGDQTSYFTATRRVKALLSLSNIYGSVSNSTYNSGPNSTTVVITWDSAGLDNTVTDVQISALNPAFNSIPPITPSTLPPTTETSLTTPLAAIASGTNTYTATLSPVPVGYVVNQHYWIVFTNGNTTASTLNLNDLGPINIVKNGTSSLVGAEIAANQAEELFYDGVNFQIIGNIGPSVTKVYKSSTQSVTNSTTLVNDTALFFNLNANETWRFSFYLYVNTGTGAANGGFKAALTIPSGSVVWAAQSGAAIIVSGTAQTIVNAFLGPTDNMVEIIGQVICGATPGMLTLQWAQASAVTTPTNVVIGSSILATRLNP